MPIEIRELVVRARIDPGSERPAAAAGAAAGARQSEQEMVRASVREALRALDDRRER